MTRLILSLSVALVACGALLASAPDRASAADVGLYEQRMLRVINRVRADRDLPKVRLHWALDRAAGRHSRDMLRNDYFSHLSSGGTSYASRIVAAGYKRSGYSSWSVGEVLGWGKGDRGRPRAIVRGWLRSSYHRAVLLNRRWRDVGVGAAHGTFCGVSGCWVWTVDFGRRTK